MPAPPIVVADPIVIGFVEVSVEVFPPALFTSAPVPPMPVPLMKSCDTVSPAFCWKSHAPPEFTVIVSVSPTESVPPVVCRVPLLLTVMFPLFHRAVPFTAKVPALTASVPIPVVMPVVSRSVPLPVFVSAPVTTVPVALLSVHVTPGATLIVEAVAMETAPLQVPELFTTSAPFPPTPVPLSVSASPATVPAVLMSSVAPPTTVVPAAAVPSAPALVIFTVPELIVVRPV